MTSLSLSLVTQQVKNPPAMQETLVRFLGWEDLLEKAISKFSFFFHRASLVMAIHSSTLAWKIPWTEEPGRLQSMGSQRVKHD